MSLSTRLDPERLKALHDELGTMIAEEERKEHGAAHTPDRIRVTHADMTEEMQKNALEIATQVSGHEIFLRR